MFSANHASIFHDFFVSLCKIYENTTMTETLLPKGCALIYLPNVVDDRGMLTFVEGNKHIPFEIKRIFWTYQVKEGSTRGNHAHRTCSMVLFPVGGSYDIELDDGVIKCTLHMSDSHVGLLVPPGVWCKLHDFSPCAASVCLASDPYDAEDYIHDYNEFLKFVGL